MRRGTDGLRDRVRRLLAVFMLIVGGAVALVVPAAPAMANSCILNPGHSFDGHYSSEYGSNGTLQGVRATIYNFGTGSPRICNPAQGTSPPSDSSAWSMVAATDCGGFGYFQAGYLHTNLSGAPGSTYNYFFTEHAYCDHAEATSYYGIPNYGQYYCYSVFHSGLTHTWYAQAINSQDCSSGTVVAQRTINDCCLGYTPRQMQWFTEMFDHSNSTYNNSTSDSPCGYPTNHCTFNHLGYRSLDGVWHSVQQSVAYDPDCGYHDATNSATSFAVWPDFSYC